ncbi:hypothetical protein [Albibacterium profundi]|uniref:Outer membrane beta-barrel protein n=1 Tax=Albibacterium profundi TaxID=3134906 RepID=A0ABV5CBI7_9SPHI
MKNFVVILCILCMGVSTSSAQESTFVKPDRVINIGVGLGGNLYSGYGSDIKRIPAITLSYESCVKDQLFDEKSSLGVGAILGYSSAKYNDPMDDWSWKSSTFVVGARGALHYALVDKFDTYTGLMLGYNIVSTKYSGAVDAGGAASGLSWAWYLGGRYYFNQSTAAFAELGYGISVLNVGVAFKL